MRNWCFLLPFFLSCLFILTTHAGCVSSASDRSSKLSPKPAWVHHELSDHPWVGRIWSVSEQAWIEEELLYQQLVEAPLVLLGERHDNADHHLLQARVLEVLLSDSPRAVGFEMLNTDLAEAIADSRTPLELAAASSWSSRGWPDFLIYEPLFEVLYRFEGLAAAVHPPRDLLRAASMEASMSPPELPALSGDGARALSLDIERSHCGYATPKLLEMMTRAQRFKDWTMFNQLTKVAGAKKRVLIAGNGHIRSDYGVPTLEPRAVSVAMMEVRVGEEADPGVLPYDFVWYTPAVDLIDPCVKFKLQLEQMQKRMMKKGGATLN